MWSVRSWMLRKELWSVAQVRGVVYIYTSDCQRSTPVDYLACPLTEGEPGAEENKYGQGNVSGQAVHGRLGLSVVNWRLQAASHFWYANHGVHGEDKESLSQ